MGHVVAVVHSEYEGAVGVRVGDCGGGGALSVDCCHSKDGRRSPEIEANIGSRMITWLGFLKRASWISEMPSNALRETEGMRSGFWPQEHQIFSV